jgi:hypothetical protein
MTELLPNWVLIASVSEANWEAKEVQSCYSNPQYLIGERNTDYVDQRRFG